jgi:hypothetical protein
MTASPIITGTDLILADDNPLEDLNVLTIDDNCKIIMKDGKIYKNAGKCCAFARVPVVTQWGRAYDNTAAVRIGKTNVRRT